MGTGPLKVVVAPPPLPFFHTQEQLGMATTVRKKSLEESLSITTGHCDLAIATHARKMIKKY